MERMNECDWYQSSIAGTSAEDAFKNMDFPTEHKVQLPQKPARNFMSPKTHRNRRANTSTDLWQPIREGDSLETQIIELKNKLKISEQANSELEIKNKNLVAAIRTSERERANANGMRGRMSITIGNLRKQMLKLEDTNNMLNDKVAMDTADHKQMIAELEKCNHALSAENQKYAAIINNIVVENAEVAQRINNITKTTAELNAVLQELNKKFTTLDIQAANIFRKYELEIFHLSTKNMAVLTSMEQEKADICAELQNLIRKLGGDVSVQGLQGEYDGAPDQIGEKRELGDLVSEILSAVQQLTVKNANLEVELTTRISENERIDNDILNLKKRMRSLVVEQAEMLDDLAQVNESLEKDVRSLFDKIEQK